MKRKYKKYTQCRKILTVRNGHSNCMEIRKSNKGSKEFVWRKIGKKDKNKQITCLYYERSRNSVDIWVEKKKKSTQKWICLNNCCKKNCCIVYIIYMFKKNIFIQYYVVSFSWNASRNVLSDKKEFFCLFQAELVQKKKKIK